MGNDLSSGESDGLEVTPSEDRTRQQDISQSALNQSEADEEVVPPELTEALEQLPQAFREKVSTSSFLMGGVMSPRSNALTKKITTEHISQTLENFEKESERNFKRSQSSENTKRLGMGAILVLVLMVFAYAGLTKDKELAEKVIIAGISGLGGYGAGLAMSKQP